MARQALGASARTGSRRAGQTAILLAMMPSPVLLRSPPPPPLSSLPMNDDYARIERAIHFLRTRVQAQPSLEDAATHLGLSPFHFQRLFQRWAGISPKRFVQFLTLRDAKVLLIQSRSLLETSYAVGLSGPSRLHDLFLTLERMTPGEFKAGAKGMPVHWDVDQTPLGPALFAALERGLCGISFVTRGERQALEELRGRWPEATLVRSPSALRGAFASFRARFRGEPGRPLSLVLKGTPLQLRTWEALLRIPPGQVLAYSDLAALAGAPRAVRAVGTAVAQNPLAGLIPCHRVIRSTGVFGEYHWGEERKLALLGAEYAQAGTPT
jgi:AraC family transcriptional regulator of adaptative response/methylated-DNA-[protein]-cysteine methyltransferase